MEKRIVKKTREELSPIGFGAMRLPSKNGKINYKESEKLIHHAIDNGINIIDTAAIYNNGESEKVLGKALKGEYRNKVKISTKLPAMNIKKYEDMEKILNEQLERLQIDCIDYFVCSFGFRSVLFILLFHQKVHTLYRIYSEKNSVKQRETETIVLQ